MKSDGDGGSVMAVSGTLQNLLAEILRVSAGVGVTRVNVAVTEVTQLASAGEYNHTHTHTQVHTHKLHTHMHAH